MFLFSYPKFSLQKQLRLVQLWKTLSVQMVQKETHINWRCSQIYVCSFYLDFQINWFASFINMCQSVHSIPMSWCSCLISVSLTLLLIKRWDITFKHYIHASWLRPLCPSEIRKSENPKVFFGKYGSQVVRNTVRSFKQIQLIIF